ncbi:MAG: DUF5131 family protein [Rhodospirillales bacterium]|nr:DUF5131 family protein [Rhodospirillales bacterium]
MCDLLHEDLAEQDIKRVWQVMSETPQHTYQVLTKRPERMQQITPRLGRLPNVWLGTSVETSEFLGRIEHLRQVDCVVRFVSFEPLIGAVGSPNLKDIHWAIVGGESGPGARPMEPEWVDEILTSCRYHRTAFFFKQWGGKQKKRMGRELGGRTYDEFPQDQVSSAK